MMNIKRVAVMQDISGLGRCSLAAALPALSAMGVQCCPVPTAVFTNQTGFSSFASFDCEPLLKDFTLQWKKHGVALDGIHTGFMSTAAQLEAAQRLIDTFRGPDTLLLIDPVMGDNGARYPCFDETFCDAMRAFAAQADVLTPNVTEACMLTGTDYDVFLHGSEHEQEDYFLHILTALPSRISVVTGWRRGDVICNGASGENTLSVYESPAIDGSWSGTGDLFASALCGGLVRGDPLDVSVRRAMRFLEACLRDAARLDVPEVEGVPFELHLKELMD